MRMFVAFLYFSWGLHVILAQNFIEDALRQSGACFPTVESPKCTAPLWKSFKSKYPVEADGEPTTLVYLFTPKSPDVAEPIHLCGGRLPDDSTYDPNANTEIFVHGYLDGVCRTAWMRECKEQLYERAKVKSESYNVILFDWTWGNTNIYFPATQNLKVVGDQMAFVIGNIMKQKNIGPEKFHIIGHSLGAHIAAYASKNLEAGLIRRITALDPALPEFLHVPPQQRITYRDAEIVDVIHTDASLVPYLFFGDIREVGHADFYPNGGSVQLGCYTYIFNSFLKGDVLSALISFLPMFCFHLQACAYYMLSINPQGCQYVGIRSSSYETFLSHINKTTSEWAVMGMDFEEYYKKSGGRKKYYLSTSEVCPFYDNNYWGNYDLPFKTAC